MVRSFGMRKTVAYAVDALPQMWETDEENADSARKDRLNSGFVRLS